MISVMDYLQDVLFEHAFKRKELLQNISNFRKQIALNLIKIALFGQESTWKNEFETFIEDIAEMKTRIRTTKFLPKHYYNEIFDKAFEPINPWNNSYIYSNIMNGKRAILRDPKYVNLQHIEINQKNIELIHNKIKELIKNVSILLSSKEFNYDHFYKLTFEYVNFWENYFKINETAKGI